MPTGTDWGPRTQRATLIGPLLGVLGDIVAVSPLIRGLEDSLQTLRESGAGRAR